MSPCRREGLVLPTRHRWASLASLCQREGFVLSTAGLSFGVSMPAEGLRTSDGKSWHESWDRILSLCQREGFVLPTFRPAIARQLLQRISRPAKGLCTFDDTFTDATGTFCRISRPAGGLRIPDVTALIDDGSLATVSMPADGLRTFDCTSSAMPLAVCLYASGRASYS